MLRYRAFRRIVAVPLIVLASYAAAGALGGLIPTNAAWRAPAEGIRIYVADNGVHTSIVLPAADVADIVRPEHFRDQRYARHRWRGFGFGDRAFYLETPSWWDVRIGTAIRAVIGNDRTVLHVDALPEPVVGAEARSVTLRLEEYRRLLAFIRATLAHGTPVRGFGPDDAFYPADGHYSAVHTCNAWTGDALRHAGVRVGAWTPFPATVMRWLPE